MKTHLFSLFLTLSFSATLFAQSTEYFSSISRENPQNYQVLNSNQDSIIIQHKKEEISLIQGQNNYFLIDGEGREKDAYKVRERNKKYLISSQNDTLLVVRNSSQIEVLDKLQIKTEKTTQGWNYLDSENNLICELEFLWNKSQWRFSLKNHQQGDEVEALNKFIMLSLSNLARKEMASEKSKNDDSDFWFIMWAASIGC